MVSFKTSLSTKYPNILWRRIGKKGKQFRGPLFGPPAMCSRAGFFCLAHWPFNNPLVFVCIGSAAPSLPTWIQDKEHHQSTKNVFIAFEHTTILPLKYEEFFLLLNHGHYALTCMRWKSVLAPAVWRKSYQLPCFFANLMQTVQSYADRVVGAMLLLSFRCERFLAFPRCELHGCVSYRAGLFSPCSDG